MKNKLWTKDFTILTLGSIVSMFGNAISGFAIGLMVLDISESTLLYAIFIFMYTLPELIMPIIFGAVLDRKSRKATIYMLDFISSGLYLSFALVMWKGWFSFPIFAMACFVLGSVESIYHVAYDSFYPLLISEGNFQKAYSISGVLHTMTAVMVPVSAFLYRKIGLAPLLLIDAISFFIAAVMETQIEQDEGYIETQKATALEGANRIRQTMTDTKEGFQYLMSEKGLLAVAVYFGFSAICEGVSGVVTLPYFKGNFNNGEYIFMLVMGASVIGRSIGGGIHYKMALPARWRFSIALGVYLMINLFEAVYLFVPLPLMVPMMFMCGLGGVTSYTIRISSTQSYVPDEKKGRFNGAFNVISRMGALLGQMMAGLLSEIINERFILMGAMMLSFFAAVVIIGGSRDEVSRIYNRVQ